jgi:flagellar assembly factor FliW
MVLKIAKDLQSQNLADTEHKHQLDFPQGLFGFPEIRSMSLVYDHDELPFMWLREEKKDGLAFIVIEPGGIIPDYSIEVSDGDVDLLKITGEEDTMILNIVTLPAEQSSKISINLVGPVIVNRKTLASKQCIINNHEKYSARYILDLSGSGS